MRSNITGVLCLIGLVQSFTVVSPVRKVNTALSGKNGEGEDAGPFSFIGNFFQELDAFIDDATSRRLGAGSAFYGKRKSSFYGDDDKMKKRSRNKFDPTEDYRGPAQGGYFQWKRDEDTGEMKPVTRMKNKNVERKPKSWSMMNNDD